MDPIITPIVGIAASQTISGIANITTIAEGLLTFWSSIKGIVENNKSINDIIDKFINKAKQKVRNRDWLDQPIFISNAEVLENVLLKANNEKLSISGVKNIDVFNDIYDEIIYDKEFWEILQDLLTEHRLQIINNREKDIHDTSIAIQQKVDEVIAQIKTIVIAIEKANLSIDELRPYYPLDKELFINEEENRKLYRDEVLIEKIHQNLDSKHVYLIQSSEGRGKTTLCRIIASDYYSQDTKVYFVDLKSNVGIDKIRKCCIEWNKTKTKTLLVLENIHASGDLEALVSMINTYKADLRFLLNARPTESEYAMYLKELGEDNIFDLRPLPEYCKGVARCLCKDKPISEGDLPTFISKRIYSKIYANQKNAGANLRLLRIYCFVWNEGNYGSILNIREHDILEKFKSTYGLRTASRLEKNALLYLSCMYQFDVPLQEELLTDEDSDGLQGFYNKGLCTSFDGKFYLPHSVDAALLCKAICGYNQYIGKTSEMVKNKYINTILTSSNPRKFEGDFKLLIQGLINREHEFRVLINELADWPMAEKIIRTINPGFVIQAFNTRNGHSSEEILEYYNANIGWLKTSILELSAGGLDLFCHIYKKYTKHSAFEGLFMDLEELNNYLRINEKVFCGGNILEAISGLGEEYKRVLIECYKQNIDRLKPSFLELSPVQLLFIYRFFKSDLNIFKDIFKDPKDLENYLRNNDKIFCDNRILEAISGLGVGYKHVLIDYYEQNKYRLKPSFLELSPVQLLFIYRFFKSDLNIFKDIFEAPKDLEDYLRNNDKVFRQNKILEAISGIGEEYKHFLIDYYKQNIDRLKPSFLELSPATLVFVYKFFQKHFKHNILEDLFEDSKDLDDYLKSNYKVFLDGILLAAIVDLKGENKQILLNNYEQNKDRLKPSFLELSPVRLLFIYLFFKNDLIHNIIGDIFKDTKDLDDYLTKYDIILNSTSILKAICDLGDEHKNVLKRYYDGIRFDYFFYTTKQGFQISQEIIDYYWFKNHNFDVFRLDNNGFYFAGIHWMDIQRFVKIIQKSMNLNNQQQSVVIVKAIIQKVLEIKGSLSHASAHDLSHFYSNIAAVDEETYQSLLDEEPVISDINRRLGVFSFTNSNLYLFGHFYSREWCKTNMNELIDNADEEQQKVIKEWHDKVMKGLEKGGKTLDIGTLWDYIHNKFFNEQQNN